jgi:putative addiction module component (TIGR02574 family)
MSFVEMLEQLPALTFEERQQLVARVLEMDQDGISPADRVTLEERWAEHQRDPESALSHEEFKAHLQALRER